MLHALLGPAVTSGPSTSCAPTSCATCWPLLTLRTRRPPLHPVRRAPAPRAPAPRPPAPRLPKPRPPKTRAPALVLTAAATARQVCLARARSHAATPWRRGGSLWSSRSVRCSASTMRPVGCPMSAGPRPSRPERCSRTPTRSSVPSMSTRPPGAPSTCRPTATGRAGHCASMSRPSTASVASLAAPDLRIAATSTTSTRGCRMVRVAPRTSGTSPQQTGSIIGSRRPGSTAAPSTEIPIAWRGSRRLGATTQRCPSTGWPMSAKPETPTTASTLTPRQGSVARPVSGLGMQTRLSTRARPATRARQATLTPRPMRPRSSTSSVTETRGRLRSRTCPCDVVCPGRLGLLETHLSDLRGRQANYVKQGVGQPPRDWLRCL